MKKKKRIKPIAEELLTGARNQSAHAPAITIWPIARIHARPHNKPNRCTGNMYICMYIKG